LEAVIGTFTSSDREAAKVCGRVVLAGLVVPVPLGIPGRHRVLQPVQDIVPQPRFVVIHEHRGADVHGAHEHEAVADATGAHLRGDVVRDVDDLLAALGLEPEVVGMYGHGPLVDGG
jgi:hypothetical protein